MTGRFVVCADIGSTYTKVAAVDLDAAAIVATAQRPTTAGGDVLDGLDAAVAALAHDVPGAERAQVRACSSAGGGLRLAVVGYEALVSADAGRRVALTAGARVVHVTAGRLAADDVAALVAARPDVVLLVGGTDGGDADVLRHNAGWLAGIGPAVPVVIAGNVDAHHDALAVLGACAVAVDNVLPRIGVARPEPARSAIRAAFLRHVIGGAQLSRGPRLAAVVRAATPDTVLTAVQLLAGRTGHDLLVVDVGGATTDVYSAVDIDGEAGVDGRGPAVAGVLRCARTVEGDLGVRAGAAGVVAAARAERLLDDAQAMALSAQVDAMTHRPAGEHGGLDLRLAELATVVAVRRHARSGRDLRHVRLVVGSGGVLRHAAPSAARAMLARAMADTAGGWALPRAPTIVVDRRYALAPVGLLCTDHAYAAGGVLRRDLDVQ